MTILITGATGAIGIPLTEHLVETHQVTALVRDPNSRAARHLKDKGALLLRASLPDELPAPSLFKQFDVVIHLAADISFSLTGKTIKEINVEGIKVLLTRLRPDTHLIFTSTALVHGPSDTPVSEDATANPLDSYTRSKWEAEEEIRKAHRKTGQRYTILRPAFIVTPTPSGLRQKFLKLASLPLVPLPGGGTNRLPFLSYKDLIRAIDLVLMKGPLNDALLITHHTPLPLRTMLEPLNGPRPWVIPLPRWTAAPLPPYLRALLTEDWYFTSSKAAKRLEWNPKYHPFTHKTEKRSRKSQEGQRRSKR